MTGGEPIVDLEPSSHPTDAARTEHPLVLGRRGFVGSLAGAASTVFAVRGADAAVPGLSGEVARRTGRTPRGRAYEQVTLRVGDVRFAALLPAARSAAAHPDVAWLETSGRDGAPALATAAVDAGVIVLLPPADASERERLVVFHWAAEELAVGATTVVASGGACVAACAVVAERLLPRIRGLYLLDPADDVDPGAAPYWRGRSVRVASRPGKPASDRLEHAWATMRRGGAEVDTASVGDAGADLRGAMRTWRAA